MRYMILLPAMLAMLCGGNSDRHKHTERLQPHDVAIIIAHSENQIEATWKLNMYRHTVRGD